MKNVFLLLLPILFLACNSPSAQEKVDNTKINWISLEEAQAKNKKNPKKLLVDMYTHWCGPCKMMMRSTFTDAEVIKHVNENYYAVKFNAESGEPVKFKEKEYSNPRFDASKGKNRRNSPHEFTSAMGIRGYPTLLILDENLNVLQKIVGFKKAPQLLPQLNALAAK